MDADPTLHPLALVLYLLLGWMAVGVPVALWNHHETHRISRAQPLNLCDQCRELRRSFNSAYELRPRLRATVLALLSALIWPLFLAFLLLNLNHGSHCRTQQPQP